MSPFEPYLQHLQEGLGKLDLGGVERLAQTLGEVWQQGRQVFLCGNGGSAANALHLANDLLYGVSKETGPGLRVQALPANTSVLTCLANDLSYEQIFSAQLAVLGQPGDVLIVLSGSGNSPNILRALETARDKGMKTFALLGYSGGKAKALVDVPIHVPLDDMQVAEDLQLVIGHMVMRWLCDHPPPTGVPDHG